MKGLLPFFAGDSGHGVVCSVGKDAGLGMGKLEDGPPRLDEEACRHRGKLFVGLGIELALPHLLR